jgi:hypothetical protein
MSNRISFYEKFIKTSQKGFTLRGGYHAKWRLPTNYALYRKRIDAGPEAERPRSVWSNWYLFYLAKLRVMQSVYEVFLLFLFFISKAHNMRWKELTLVFHKV